MISPGCSGRKQVQNHHHHHQFYMLNGGSNSNNKPYPYNIKDGEAVAKEGDSSNFLKKLSLPAATDDANREANEKKEQFKQLSNTTNI